MVNTGFSYFKTILIAVVIYFITFIVIVLFLFAWLIYVFYALLRYKSFKRIKSPFTWLNEPLDYIGNLK